MATSYADPVVWATLAAIGAVTFSIRFSFIGLFGYVDEIPPGVERVLRYVPAAVLAALVAPAVLTVDPATGGVATDKLLAGAVAAGVAWRTEDIFATIAVGMVTLWVVRFGIAPIL